MRIIFAGTPEFAVPALLSLIDSSHEVVGVYTQADRKSGRGQKVTAPPVKQVALSHDIPVEQPDSLKTPDALSRLQSFNADLMVVVAYGMLLPQTVLDLPTFGCINIHASLLPRWRGAAPIQRAIQAGDQRTGVSIMQMELGLDTGPVICDAAVDIGAQDTSASLHDALSVLGASTLTVALQKVTRTPPESATPQNADLATYAKKLSKSEAAIDWAQSATVIDCSIRAFNPWPVCQTRLADQRVRVWFSEQLNHMPHDNEPGTIVAVDDDGITVACGTGAVRILTLQRDGGKPLPCREFLNGFPIRVGQRFTSAD